MPFIILRISMSHHLQSKSSSPIMKPIWPATVTYPHYHFRTIEPHRLPPKIPNSNPSPHRPSPIQYIHNNHHDVPPPGRTPSITTASNDHRRPLPNILPTQSVTLPSRPAPDPLTYPSMPFLQSNHPAPIPHPTPSCAQLCKPIIPTPESFAPRNTIAALHNRPPPFSGPTAGSSIPPLQTPIRHRLLLSLLRIYAYNHSPHATHLSRPILVQSPLIPAMGPSTSPTQCLRSSLKLVSPLANLAGPHVT
ncbi:unnamed protein product [Dicrocoelium dendriticum]|nr:unnamed protein product [Dicrocoelium dendriticum]